MRIAVVLNTSWNIYNFRKGLLKALMENGHEIHTIAPIDAFTEKLILLGCVHHDLKMDSRGANPIKDAGLIMELRSIYKKVKPDIILHFTIKPNIYGTLAAATLGIPVINNVCGLGTVFLKGGFISIIAKKLYKFSFRHALKVFFQNQEDLQLFLENELVAAEACEILPGSGINVTLYEPEPIKKNEVFTFLLISRIIYDKGIVEFVDAIRILKSKGIKARFQLLGGKDTLHKSGIPEKVILGWINKGLLEYLGKTDNVIPYINSADCVVLPSYREGSPRSLMEAAALAKPIIATNVAGCNQVVKDQYNGFLCELKSATDLADKMIKMINLPEEKRIQMGENGRKKMEQEFSEKVVINKYRTAINSTLSVRANTSLRLA